MLSDGFGMRAAEHSEHRPHVLASWRVVELVPVEQFVEPRAVDQLAVAERLDLDGAVVVDEQVSFTTTVTSLLAVAQCSSLSMS